MHNTILVVYTAVLIIATLLVLVLASISTLVYGYNKKYGKFKSKPNCNGVKSFWCVVNGQINNNKK